MKYTELQTQNSLPLVANEGQERPQEYLFSSARDYAGEKGYVDVQIEI